MKTSGTIAKIAVALLKAQQSMGDAVKGSKNPFFKSSYADLNSIRETAIPALNAVGVSVLQPTVHIDGRNFVHTLLLHESGEYLSAETEILSAKPSDPQAQGSGISYARRYGLQSLLNIGAVDDDGEGAMQRTPAKQEVAKPALVATSSKASVQVLKEAVTLLIQNKHLNATDYVNDLKTTFGVDKTDKLSDTDATTLYNKIKTTYSKELQAKH